MTYLYLDLLEWGFGGGAPSHTQSTDVVFCGFLVSADVGWRGNGVTMVTWLWRPARQCCARGCRVRLVDRVRELGPWTSSQCHRPFRGAFITCSAWLPSEVFVIRFAIVPDVLCTVVVVKDGCFRFVYLFAFSWATFINVVAIRSQLSCLSRQQHLDDDFFM